MYIIKEGYGQSQAATRRKYSSPVLPIGIVDLKTGKNKYLDNIFTTWNDYPMTVEFYESYDKTIRIVITAGKKPIKKVGEQVVFIHDQNNRDLFAAKMIDYCLLNDLPKYASKYGAKLKAFVYK